MRQLERLREVVTNHLDRFAFREAPLSFEWSRGEKSGFRFFEEAKHHATEQVL